MVYVASDWHGYPLEKIKELLSRANFSQNDYCFVLGDVIDTGASGGLPPALLRLDDMKEFYL